MTTSHRIRLVTAPLTWEHWLASFGSPAQLRSRSATCWWSWGSRSRSRRTTPPDSDPVSRVGKSHLINSRHEVSLCAKIIFLSSGLRVSSVKAFFYPWESKCNHKMHNNKYVTRLSKCCTHSNVATCVNSSSLASKIGCRSFCIRCIPRSARPDELRLFWPKIFEPGLVHLHSNEIGLH